MQEASDGERILATVGRLGAVSRWMLGAGVVLIILFAMLVSIFALPGYDDWCFAIGSGGPIEFANFQFFHWSGRWLSMALLTAMAQSVDLTGDGYRVVVAVVSFPIWFAAFFLVARQVMDGWRAQALAAMALLAIFWTSIPRPMEVFYWMAGVACYAPAFLAAVVTVHFARRGAVALATVAALLPPFLNELSALMTLPFLLVLAPRDRRMAWPIAAMLLSLAIVTLAPGNTVRVHAVDRPSLAWIAWSMGRPYLSPVSLLADPRLLMMMLAVLSLPGSPARADWRDVRWIAAVVAGMFGSAAAITWSTGTTLEPRVLAFMFAALLSTAFVTAWRLRGIARQPIVNHLATAALGLLLVTSPNVAEFVKVLPESLATRRLYDAHFANLRARAGQDVVVPPMGQTLFNGLYGPDPDAGSATNKCEAAYFGLRSIRVEGSLQPS